MLRAWDIAEPTAVERPAHGTNNTVRIVHTASSSYVLRVYQNASPTQVAAEQRLLQALSGTGRLSFRVPLPIPATSGQTFIVTPDGPASLTPWIPGEHPQRDQTGLELAGAALGELDAALAQLPTELAPVDWTTRTLSQIHPHVPDMAALAGELTRLLPSEPSARWFAERAPRIEAQAAQWYEILPRQIVHGDCALGNVLIDGGRVAGVLDFEIAGLDLRVNDLMAALTYATNDFQPDLVAAFRRGYAAHVTLSQAEHRAMPDLIRYRALGSIVWRAGRWRAGHSTLDEVVHRLRRGVELDSAAEKLG